MKKINTLLLSAALVSALASCEMKEELIGGKGSSDEMGLLDLTVATSSSSNTVVTKAVTDVVDDFPVYIVAAPGDTTKRFASFAELREQNPIELPFGTYTVVSNSPVPYERKMQYPYYKGEESVEISEVTGKKTTVKCTIQNVKIAFVPSAAFRNTYSDWTITVSDRLETSNNSDALITTFTPANSGTDSQQAYEYWKLGNDVDKIYINGTATLKDGGETVTVYGVAEKKNLQGHTDKDGNFFKGGDELVINLNPDKIEGSTAGVEKPGVIITIGGFNSETNETIEIDVTGDGNEPTPPTPSGEISLQLPEDITYSKSAGDAPEKADAIISAPKGLKTVIVKIVPGNEEFKGILENLKLGEANDLNAPTFLEGVDIVDNKYLEAVFAEVGQSISAPASGETEPYTFPIGNFFTFLNIAGATDSGTPHQFVIEVTDKEGNKANDTLNVTINE